MFVAVSDHSEDIDTHLSFTAVHPQCEAALKDPPPQADVLFAGINFEHQQLREANNRIWPDITLIGRRTNGEVFSPLGFREASILLPLPASDNKSFTSGLEFIIGSNVCGARASVVLQARENFEFKPRLFITALHTLEIIGQQKAIVL